MKKITPIPLSLTASLCKGCGKPIVTIEESTVPPFLLEIYRKYGGKCRACTTDAEVASMEAESNKAIIRYLVDSGIMDEEEAKAAALKLSGRQPDNPSQNN